MRPTEFADRLLLFALPARLRREFGDDMAAMLTKQIAEVRPRRASIVRLWVRAAADARLALGAQPHTATRMIVGEGMILIAAGLAIGLPLAFAATRLLRSLLFETAPHDLLSFTAAGAVSCGIALAACAIPALRASRLSPVTALRID